MNYTLKSLGILLAIGLASLLVLLQFPILGIAGFGCLGLLIASGSNWGKDRKASIIMSEHLSFEGRRILRPIRRLAAFNRELARKHRHALVPDHQALVETENVLRQCVRWLEVRDRLVDSLQCSVSSESQALVLNKRLQSFHSEVEKRSLEHALLEAEELIQARHQTQRQVREIEARIVHAQFSMEYLKTILTLAAMSPKEEDPSAVRQGSGLSMGR